MLKALLGGAAALVLSTAAQAQIAAKIWTGVPTSVSGNATIAAAGGLGTPSATTTLGPINFDSRAGGCNCYTVGGFLNNPILPPAVASSSLLNTYMLLTGKIALSAGPNVFTITHDDGLQLAIGDTMVVNQPGATGPADTLFTYTAPSAGIYNFTLSYGECCGPPAVLKWSFRGAPVGGVPEPATWAMMLLGFAGIGMAVRKRKTVHAQLA